MAVLTPANALAKFAGLDLKPIEEVQYGFCGGIYGAAGVGKTTLAGTIVNSELGNPALLVDAEGGAEVVKHQQKNGLHVVSPSKWADIAEIRREYEKGNRPFKSIIFDNMSEIQFMHLRSVVPPGLQPQIQHYGQNVAEMLSFVRFWRDQSRFHGTNVVFVCWDTLIRDGDGVIIKRGVQLRPKFADSFPGIVNFVGYLYVEPKIKGWGRVLDLSPNPKQDSKFRRSLDSASQKIPLQIANPDLGAIIDTIKGGKEWDTKKYDLSLAVASSKV